MGSNRSVLSEFKSPAACRAPLEETYSPSTTLAFGAWEFRSLAHGDSPRPNTLAPRMRLEFQSSYPLHCGVDVQHRNGGCCACPHLAYDRSGPLASQADDLGIRVILGRKPLRLRLLCRAYGTHSGGFMRSHRGHPRVMRSRTNSGLAARGRHDDGRLNATHMCLLCLLAW